MLRYYDTTINFRHFIQYRNQNNKMQIPFSILQRSQKSEIKDLAFFEILKRKGPYIQRSLIKIENDLIYKHKINATKITNVSFVKQIRQNLSSYEVIINQIKNDFLMTQLDSLGQGIHQLFSQMITIIKFFVDITLKKHKIHQDLPENATLEELKQKEAQIKRLEQQQKQKDKQKEKENQRVREIQKLKFNFRQLFRMQTQTQNNHKIYELIWKSILNQTKISAQKCMTIQNVQMNKIIKDSCQFLYKNHSQLDNIIRLSKLEIIQGQKIINGFEDNELIIETNHRKISKMKNVAHQIIQHVREKVYENKCVGTQTNHTQVNSNKPMMTIRQLQERRKLNQNIKRLDQQNLNLRRKVQQLSNNCRKLQQVVHRKSFSKNYSKNQDDEEDSNCNIESSNNILNVQKFNNLKRKSKNNAYNSFKINQKTINKFRQASFTVGKQPFKTRNSQYATSSKHVQKSSNRSSKTDKDLLKKNTNAITNSMIDKKKYLKSRNSENKNVEIHSIRQLSKRSDKLQFDQAFKLLDKQNQNENDQIDDKTNLSQNNIEVKENFDRPKDKELSIVKVVSILYKPTKLKIYSKYFKQQNQVKMSLLQNFNKISKAKFQKASSQYHKCKYYFQPYKEINERYLSINPNKQINPIKSIQINQIHKKRSNSCHNCQKNKNNSIKKQKSQIVPELAVSSMLKIKSDRFKKQDQKQNKCLRKGIAKTRKNLRFNFQKQKEIVNRPAVTFSDYKQIEQVKQLQAQKNVNESKKKFVRLQV